MIEIKSRIDGKVLYTAENAQDVRTAVEEAVKTKADLSYADLRYADLRYADLRSAVLSYAVLSYADLRYADLRYADLRYADLRSAVLSYADLRYADLRYADLRSAVLSYADLRYADLRYADLTPSHSLWIFRQDVWSILDAAPMEVAGLRTAVAEGRIDGSAYAGECACLVGTIANVRGVSVESADLGLPKDSSRPAEQWFMPIREGDRPLGDPAEAETEGVFRASCALRWIDEWFASRKQIAAALTGAKAA